MSDPRDDLGFDWGHGEPEVAPGATERSVLDQATGATASYWGLPGLLFIVFGLIAFAKGFWGPAVGMLIGGGVFVVIGVWKYRRIGRL